MKHKHERLLRGYVTILVNGHFPELFFQRCAEAGIIIWDIKKGSETSCQGKVSVTDLKYLKEVKQADYEVIIEDLKGFPALIKIITNRKELLVAFIVSSLFIILLSNVVWDIKITGVPKEIEEQISEKLATYGVNQGKLMFFIESPSIIQSKLINDLPELLWIGVKKSGTTFQLEGITKVAVDEQEINEPQHIIAKKDGVISKMFIAQGLPLVQVHDFVKKGELLVSGIIDIEIEDESETKEIVSSQGEIWAQTWYEAKVEIPLLTEAEIVTGKKTKHYGIQISKLYLPVWGWRELDNKLTHVEIDTKNLYVKERQLPISLVTRTIHEKEYVKKERTVAEARGLGISQAKKDLQLELGPNINILKEKILHETSGSGKVNLHLYFTVEENIAEVESITQGD